MAAGVWHSAETARRPVELELTAFEKACRPFAVVAGPARRLPDPGLQLVGRPEPEPGFGLAWFDQVASVVVRTVRDELRPLLEIHAQSVSNEPDDVPVASFLTCREVIDRQQRRVSGSRRRHGFSSTGEYELDPPAVVFDVQPVPELPAVPVERDAPAAQYVADRQWYELLRELPRPVVVGTVRQRQVELGVRLHVRPHQQISSSFGRRIWGFGVQRTAFREVRNTVALLAVHLNS